VSELQCNNLSDIVESIKAYDGYKARAVRGGMSLTKGSYLCSESIPRPQASHGGATARVNRVYDRAGDSYKEKVVDCETGEVIHKTEENLTDHKGHGPNKR
jgi:hypothetical protein